MLGVVLGGVGQKKYPPSRGVMATFATKAGQSYGVVCDGAGAVWAFLGGFGVLFVPLWVAVGCFCVPLRYGHFTSR